MCVFVLQDLRKRMEFREKAGHFFADTARHTATILKNCSSSELMKNMYHVTGHMVKYCAPLIYIKVNYACVM